MPKSISQSGSNEVQLQKQNQLPQCRRSLQRVPSILDPDSKRDRIEDPAAPHTTSLRPAEVRAPDPRHTMNWVPGWLLDECCEAFRPLLGRTNRWHPCASSSTRRPSRPSPAAWSRFWNGAASRAGSLSMPASWHGDSGSSAPGSTPTRSNWARSSSVMDRSLGCVSTRRSRRGRFGRLAGNRRLTRPPTRSGVRAGQPQRGRGSEVPLLPFDGQDDSAA